jgi:thiol-disulfide isomerase/thioredoxin
MKSTNIIIAIVVLVLIGGGIYALNENTGTESMMKDEMMQSDRMMMENEAMMQKDTMMKDDAMMSSSSDAMMMIKGASYEAYAPEKLANAESGNVVLFFRAGWCPTCRTVDADIKANMKNIPANLTILDVDYDKSSDLKKKYGVTYQHTFVQVDAKGELIKKWMGGSTLASVVGQVK